MRITNQLLRVRARGPLHSVEYLDLSNQNIERIEKLQTCTKLVNLSLRGNNVDYVSNLEHCSQLWKLDLANNRVKSLEGLSRFVALGTLNLSNNQLSWTELTKIRHVHILDLSLHGNPQLEKDPYYRIHVIDSLPNVWMLDGRIITSAERLQVQHFFQESALTDHPVRHKLSKEQFRPTSRKNIEVHGTFGEKTTHMMRRFPVNGMVNRDLDRRRLQYLAFNKEEDLRLEMRNSSNKAVAALFKSPFMEDLIKARQRERERCNMVLLLVVASLEFSMPTILMKASLEATQLMELEGVNMFQLFLLPREARCGIVSLLLSAVKMDKDMGEEGGLYDKLYLCLYYSISELTKLAQGGQEKTTSKTTKNNSAMCKEYRCLIAAEVIQLFCIVPKFFDYLNKDIDVMSMVLAATGNATIGEQLREILERQPKVDRREVLEEAASVILCGIQSKYLNSINKNYLMTSDSNYVLNTWKSLPRRPMSTPMVRSDYHCTGRSSPSKKSSKPVRHNSARAPGPVAAKLGDSVLLGPQNVGRIISMPESDIVLVQMDVVPAETGAMVSNTRNPEDHYTYINLKQVYWDSQGGYWRPKGTVGDRITIQAVDMGEFDTATSSVKLANPDSAAPASPSSPRPARGLLASPRNLLQELRGRKQLQPTKLKRTTSVASPRPVSAQLKEKFNLRLDTNLGKCDPARDPVHSRAANAHLESHPKVTQDSQRPHAPTKRMDLAREVANGMVFVEGTGISRPPSASLSLLTPSQSREDFDQSDTGTAISRRSSLDSTEESELGPFSQESRPSTAHASRPDTAFSRKSGFTATTLGKTESMVTCTPDCPIEIPQATVDPDSQAETPTSCSRQDLTMTYPGPPRNDTGSLNSDGCMQCAREAHARALELEVELRLMESPPDGSSQQSGRVSTRAESSSSHLRVEGTGSRKTSRKGKVPRVPLPSSQPAQLGCVEGYRMIVCREPGAYGTPYQNQRTEAWKHTSTPSTPAGSEFSQPPPPQRPSSPIHKHTTCEKSVSNVSNGLLKLQTGDTWLAGGRDLHWEDLSSRSRGKTGQPSWKEALRPKSAAAVRAMRRSKTPNIVTPSSLAYDCAYACARGSPVIPTDVPKSADPPAFSTSLATAAPVHQNHPRSDFISIDDYAFLNPKRVRFHATSSYLVAPRLPPRTPPRSHLLCENCLQRYTEQDARRAQGHQEEEEDTPRSPALIGNIHVLNCPIDSSCEHRCA